MVEWDSALLGDPFVARAVALAAEEAGELECSVVDAEHLLPDPRTSTLRSADVVLLGCGQMELGSAAVDPYADDGPTLVPVLGFELLDAGEHGRGAWWWTEADRDPLQLAEPGTSA